MYNEQRQIAYINMEYCYLQYCCGLSKSLSASGTHSSFLYDNFRDCGDPVQFAGKELWPKFLSQVIMVLQKPMYDMQKRSFVYHETKIVKWDDQHDIKGKVKYHNSRTGKREAVATRTFIVVPCATTDVPAASHDCRL
ncbi:TPA: hypothetical protein ACH3X1_004855 [Trebouxia sp. C0004]